MAAARIEHSTEIAAPIELVWKLTENVESWPEFVPTMHRVKRLDSGPLTLKSAATISQPRQPETTWIVTALDAPTMFAWESKRMGLRLRASHELETVGYATRNTLAVELSGWAAGLMTKLVGGKIAEAIAAENRGFKARAEELARGVAGSEERSAEG